MDKSLTQLKFRGERKHSREERAVRKKEGFEAEKILVLPEHFIRNLTRHPLAKILFVTDIGYFPNAKYHYRERSNGCDSYILIFCVNGEGWVRVGDTELREVRKYDLVVLPPHISHSYGASDTNPWSIYWIHFRGDLACHYFELLPLSDHMLQVSGSDAVRLIELFNPCYELLSEKSYSLSHCLFANQLLQHMLGILSLQISFSGDKMSNEYVEQSIQYMRQHIGANLKLSQLSDQANLSKSHYLALFKRVTGTSPLHYFMKLKIQQACTYLDLTEWSIKEISAKLGFQDSLYFSRVFRKVMGQSPSDYRKKIKG
jgi:AraC-like DNA-binding protein